MKLSRREVVLLVFLFIVMSVVGYYFFFFQPTTAKINEVQDSIDRKTTALDAAAMRVVQHGVLTGRLDKLIEEWQGSLDVIPKSFDEADFLTRVEGIISSHTDSIKVVFPDSGVAQIQTVVYLVGIEFTVPYRTLQTILKDFEQEDIINRIINMDLNETSSGDADVSEPLLRVMMTVDLLTRQLQ